MPAGLSNIRRKSQEAKGSEEFGRSIIVPVTDLVDDPDNKTIYGDYDSDGLAESIEENGFRGRIYAYPVSGGKYMIESGHRTKEAAVKAGKMSVPVIVTKAPASDTERRKRLVLANLHGRKYTPLMIARQAEYLLATYEEEDKDGKKEALMKKVAKDLEVSVPMLYKYLMLTSLIPELQELAESGEYAWTAIAPASKLNDVQQLQLRDRILGQARLGGAKAVTQTWIEQEIEEYKYVKSAPTKLSFDPGNIFEGITPMPERAEEKSAEKPSRKRRADGTKAILKSREMIEGALSDDSIIKPKDRAKVREALLEIRDMVDRAVKDLGEVNYS